MNQNLIARMLSQSRERAYYDSLVRKSTGFEPFGKTKFGQRGGVGFGSNIRRTEERVQLDGVAVAVGGQQIRIPLNKQSLVEEHYVRVQVAQAFTNAPVSSDVRRFITSLSIESSDGRRKFMTGYQAYDLGRFTESGDQPVVGLAAVSTADFMFCLHHANDFALHDMMAAVDAAKLNTFDLVIQFAADANNGFIGGTVPLAAAYTVTVRNSNFPGMLLDKGGNPHPFVEALRHVFESQSVAGAAGGGTTAPLLRLTAGNKTRFISVHTYDTTGVNPVPADNVMSNIRLNINGQERRITDYITMQKKNSADRQFYIKGCCVLDFGNDEAGFLDLRGVAEPYLSWDIAAGPPATWRVDFGQDYSIVMK
jgi:hypothetical protein